MFWIVYIVITFDVCLPHIMVFVYIFVVYISFEWCIYITFRNFALLI